jgi:hypothetical protein
MKMLRIAVLIVAGLCLVAAGAVAIAVAAGVSVGVAAATVLGGYAVVAGLCLIALVVRLSMEGL